MFPFVMEAAEAGLAEAVWCIMDEIVMHKQPQKRSHRILYLHGQKQSKIVLSIWVYFVIAIRIFYVVPPK